VDERKRGSGSLFQLSSLFQSRLGVVPAVSIIYILSLLIFTEGIELKIKMKMNVFFPPM